MAIGIKVNGSLQPINIAEGNKTKNANSIPFIIGLIFKSIVDMKKPTTIHMVNADKFASHVRFCRIIGITSIIPAIIPDRIPIFIFSKSYLVTGISVLHAAQTNVFYIRCCVLLFCNFNNYFSHMLALT